MDQSKKSGSSENPEMMTERQQVEFLKQMTSEPVDTGAKTELIDYHRYHRFKMKQREANLAPDVLEKRQKLLQECKTLYEQINKNIYIEKRRDTELDDDQYKCQCTPKFFTKKEAEEIISKNYEGYKESDLFGCGADCLNRNLYVECVEGECVCGVSCRNMKFQNKEYCDVYPIKTENRGWGLCAGTFIPNESFILQYIGEIYSLDSDFGRQRLSTYKNKTCTYLMNLSSRRREVIDPTRKGNLARFINHSCDPNCEIRKCRVKGEECIGIYAKRDIQEDEELTFNYDFDLSTTYFQRCLCGAKNCRGYLGLNTEENKKYLKHGTICRYCQKSCKHSDKIIVCNTCKMVYHEPCGLKKGEITEGIFKCGICIKKEEEEIEGEKNEKIRIDKEPTYDENIEVTYEDLIKIKKNLQTLIEGGVCLYWDFQSEKLIMGTNNTTEMRISGTIKQVESLKAKIKQLSETEDQSQNFISKVEVPKIFMRKIIGHQSRNLNSYKSKYNVEIDYDAGLMSDEIFQVQESTLIEIRGKEANVKAVEFQIKKYEYELKVLTIYLLPDDFNFIRMNICSIKSEIDPADLRLRKHDSKNDREIKHPFYYISNANKDIVIIGLEDEIQKAQKIIEEEVLRQNNLSFTYCLGFLFPLYFMSQLTNFISDNAELIKKKKLRVEKTDPVHPRKHINVAITGKWPDIIDFKKLLWEFAKKLIIDSEPRRHDIREFEQYVYNQEHKLVSKNLKTFAIEQCPQIKNWDYISYDVEAMGQLIEENDKNEKKYDVQNDFVKTVDKETALNYMVVMKPGSYRDTFKLQPKDLLNNIFQMVSEYSQLYEMAKSGDNNSFNYKNQISFSRVYSENKLSQAHNSTHENKSELSYYSSPENEKDNEATKIQIKESEIKPKTPSNIPISDLISLPIMSFSGLNNLLTGKGSTNVQLEQNADIRGRNQNNTKSSLNNSQNSMPTNMGNNNIQSYISYNIGGINEVNLNINNYLHNSSMIQNESSKVENDSEKNRQYTKNITPYKQSNIYKEYGNKNNNYFNKYYNFKYNKGYDRNRQDRDNNREQRDKQREREMRNRERGRERNENYRENREKQRERQYETIPNLSKTASSIDPKNAGGLKEFESHRHRSRSRSRENSGERRNQKDNYRFGRRGDRQGFYSKSFSGRFNDREKTRGNRKQE